MAQVMNIFNFLKAYNELSNPVITEIDKQRWSLDLTDIPVIDEIKSIFHGNELEELVFLKVEKPSLTACPKPDDSLLEWVENDWSRLSVSVIYHKDKLVREVQDDSGEVSYFEEFFMDNCNRVEEYEKWISRRELWREVEIPKEKGLTLYNKLFRLYSDMKKEAESVELILGDGIIRWHTEERLINHPVLLQKVILDFDPKKPMFMVRCEEIKTEIYSAMLRVITSINQKMLTDVMQDVELNSYHLPDFDNTHGLYKRLIHILDEKGEFVDTLSPGTQYAQINSHPVLFLRKRTLGYSAFLESIISEIDEKGETTLPTFFGTMAGNHQEDVRLETISEGWNHSGIDEDVLLTLPANNEQLKIIKYLDQYGAVLVQGPPGTGKTHTIANLIGHLLSQGNSVLVTSHTEKALTVLKEKVYKDPFNKDLNLQSLCISLLSSISQKKEMDEAINEIASKGTTLDLYEAERRIKRLKGERSRLIEESKKKSEQLLEIRGMEYKDLVYHNETISPIDAAKFIKAGEGKLEIIPGLTIDDTIGFPLTTEEVKFIYKSNEDLSKDEETVLNSKLPDFQSLWTIEQFSKAINEITRLKTLTGDFNPTFQCSNDENLPKYERLLSEAEGLLAELNGFSDLSRFLLTKTVQDDVYSKLWDGIFERFDILFQEFNRLKEVKFEFDFSYSTGLITEGNLTVLNEIIDTGKEIPVNSFSALIKPKWSALKNGISNNGKPIEKIGEYIAIRKIFVYEIEKRRLVKQINKLLAETDFQLDYEDPMFEMKGNRQKDELKNALVWIHSRWEAFTQDLSEHFAMQNYELNKNAIDIVNPFQWVVEILEDKIIVELNYQVDSLKLEYQVTELNQHVEYLETYQNQNEIMDQLILAARSLEKEQYAQSYISIRDVLRKRDVLLKRHALIEKVGLFAPLWAQEIDKRQGIHGNAEQPQDIEKAWKWRQLVNQIERIDAYDSNKIQREIKDLNDRLLKNARILAYESAWYEKIKNRTAKQAQAIEGWRTTIRQIGKGTGKKAPELLRRARELMPLCQTAIPVWIMPLNKVVESFDPKNNNFDVVIIDEASQSDILALAALYLGKKIIIVGDDEQVSPDSVGINTNEVDALIEMYLQGISNSHLFNGQTSLYDMAKSSGFKPLMLTEHFRCLPEIIEFSNGLSYNGRIKPLRDSSKVVIKPPVIEYRVKNGLKNFKKVNEVEATHIASLICAMVEDGAYVDKTIGVISLLGTEQSYEVDRLLQTHLSPVEYEKRRIQCGTPPQFQGDERDIILLSIVEGANEKSGPVRLLSEDGRNDMARKRYNVAASRAKDQMWVVHSLNPEIDLKPDDIRLRLIKHAQNPYIASEDAKLESAESPFEEEVMKALLNSGYKVTPQLKVGAYRIDMVVENGDKRMAIECDGEKWHTQDDLPNDLKRQSILERLGWKFIRIRGSVFYRSPIETMNAVFDELSQNGLSPDFNQFNGPDHDEESVEPDLVTRIKRRAAELRNEWNRKDEDDELGGIQISTGSELIEPVESQTNVEPGQVTLPEFSSETYEQLQIEYYENRGAETIDDDKTKDITEKSRAALNKQHKSEPVVSVEKVIEVDKIKANDVKPVFDFRNRNNAHSDHGKTDNNDGENEDLSGGFKASKTKMEPRFDFRKK